MTITCKYYSNQVRLANSVQFLSTQPSFRFFCTSGLIVKNKRNFEVLTDKVTLIVACVLEGTGKNSMMLLTSDESLRDYDGKEIDTESITHDPIFYSLCLLLQEKAAISRNDVSISFKGDQMVATISISEETESEMQCTVRGASGDIMVQGNANIRDLLSQCNSISAFRHITRSDDEQREVIVSRGRVSLLKEISRYLSRTLVLVSFLENGDMLEQYISVSGLLEITTKPDGTRIYKKVANNRLRDARAFCVYHSAAKVEDIIREQGRALHTDKKE